MLKVYNRWLALMELFLLDSLPHTYLPCYIYLPLFANELLCVSSFFLLWGGTHAPFTCQHGGLSHRLAQCTTPGMGL